MWNRRERARWCQLGVLKVIELVYKLMDSLIFNNASESTSNKLSDTLLRLYMDLWLPWTQTFGTYVDND